MTISVSTPSVEKLAVQQSQTSDHTSPYIPILWVDSLDGLDNLAQNFQLKQASDTPTKGKHIFALQSERDIRRIARSIQQEDILGIIPPMILTYSLPDIVLTAVNHRFDLWHKTISQMPLELKDALDIARDALQSLQSEEISKNQWNIEKEELRQRCNVSPFDWNQYIRDLEAEIHVSVNRKGKSERLKLEIQAWLRVSDPFEQELERIRILTHYQLKEKSFERMAQAMRLAENESANQSLPLSIGDLFGLESEPLRWLVPGFMPAKTSVLLSGLPGSGKSLLALDLAYAICRGEKFLGEQCAKGKVLYLASDQPLNQTKQYLWERGFENSDPLTIVGEGQGMSAWSVRKLEDLESWLLLGGYSLVIVDSIRSTICYPLGLEEKSEHIGHWMKEAERLVIGHGSSLLWIHHDNKDKDLKGVSRSSGSTAIPANVSVHMRIENASGDETSPMRRLTMPKTRNFEAQSLEIQFKPETYEWELIGRTGESPEVARDNQTLGQKIQALLQKHPGVGLEVSEIKQAIGDSPSVYKVLSRLEAQGILGKRRSATNSKAKVYFIADGSSDTTHLTEGGGVKQESKITDPPPPRLCPSAVETTSEIKIEKEIPSSDTHLTPPTLPQASDKTGETGEMSDTTLSTPVLTDSAQNSVPPIEQATISRCFGAITGILWQDDFSAATRRRKLVALRQQFGPTTYNAACQRLSDEDRADLEALG